MIIAFMVNTIPAQVIIQNLSEQDADTIREGTKESEEVAQRIADEQHLPLDNWLVAEDNEFVLVDKRNL